jgi:hypothetical protein
MANKHTLFISKRLAALLGNTSLLNTEKNVVPQLLLNDFDDADILELQELLKNCALSSDEPTPESQASIDYSQYFSAVMGSTLFRPANPKLALMQTAKAYHLDEQALTQAFNHNHRS